MRDGRNVPDRFSSGCAAVVARLPFGLSAVVAPSFLGFAVINGFTFTLDLLLVTLLHGVVGWPVPVAITLGYAVAFTLSYLLNRVLNFRSRAPVGPESARYVLTVAVNFGAILLGVGAGLAALGVQYQAARLLAGACEGVFMYSAMRWFVFHRETRVGAGDRDDAHHTVQRGTVRS